MNSDSDEKQQPTDESPQIAAPQETLERLQRENDDLQERLAQAMAEAPGSDELDSRLAAAEQENDVLKGKLTQASIAATLSTAGQEVGITAKMAQLYAGEFACEMTPDGEVSVTPDPVEFFRAKIASDPALARSAQIAAGSRLVTAAVNGSVELDGEGAAELMAALDKAPVRKTRFIGRHGVQAYLELCDKARRHMRMGIAHGRR